MRTPAGSSYRSDAARATSRGCCASFRLFFFLSSCLFVPFHSILSFAWGKSRFFFSPSGSTHILLFLFCKNFLKTNFQPYHSARQHLWLPVSLVSFLSFVLFVPLPPSLPPVRFGLIAVPKLRIKIYILPLLSLSLSCQLICIFYF